MAHKKGQGSSNNGRESHSKRLGVKLFGGQDAFPGNIIIRQRGTKFHAGTGVKIGKDHTIFAVEEGVVSFTTKKNNRKYVSVVPFEGELVAKEASKTVEAPKAKAEPKVKEEAKPAAKAKEEAKATPKDKKDKKGDDLKKISGVGPAFEKRLNAQGLFTYADVAALTTEDIKRIEDSDNITSDEEWNTWIEQAKELMK